MMVWSPAPRASQPAANAATTVLTPVSTRSRGQVRRTAAGSGTVGGSLRGALGDSGCVVITGKGGSTPGAATTGGSSGAAEFVLGSALRLGGTLAKPGVNFSPNCFSASSRRQASSSIIAVPFRELTLTNSLWLLSWMISGRNLRGSTPPACRAIFRTTATTKGIRSMKAIYGQSSAIAPLMVRGHAAKLPPIMLPPVNAAPSLGAKLVSAGRS